MKSHRFNDNWKGVAQFVVEQALHHFFENGKLSVRALRQLAAEHQLWKVQFIDLQRLTLVSGERFFAELQKIEPTAEGAGQLRRLAGLLEVLAHLGIVPELWKSQNHYFHLVQHHRDAKWAGVDEAWKTAFLELGKWLRMAS